MPGTTSLLLDGGEAQGFLEEGPGQAGLWWYNDTQGLRAAPIFHFCFCNCFIILITKSKYMLVYFVPGSGTQILIVW